MKKKRFAVEQIVAVLKEAAGVETDHRSIIDKICYQ
ncbi:hypothetical protein C8R21_1435 [Nitrosospira multiformis]|uniref:Uncharacterized protein n=1 Tax=Nitrosospira multiformis TaxID=1231 RepID=A0A2T5I347_9PROT|nr:hypothetical protein C8R21_1435 [Nitrosospira multiformis]